MNSSSREWLRRLGAGERITDLCAAVGIAPEEFDTWWRKECIHRVPSAEPKRSGIRIERDQRGLPTIRANDDRDLFYGWGFAVAHDRLFQLDYLRRRARGRLAEILGPEAVESDILYRTLNLSEIAEREWRSFSSDTKALLEEYSAGINDLIEATHDNPPIEFDLLDYRPQPWQPTDSLAVIGDFRWYLTGRFLIIAIPELVKRHVGEGPQYGEFLLSEEDQESILRSGEYRNEQSGRKTRGQGGGSDNDGGSNNWVLASSRSVSGKPLVASDPHIPFFAVSIWHEVRLLGGTFRAAGVALAGMPAVMIGRNERMAWGITNNICSLRDLYQEKKDPSHPNCFLHDGRWEPAQSRVESIAVRGQAPVQRTVVSSRNGPIVDDLLPEFVRSTGPVSLRWQGFEPCGWLPAMIAMNRAKNCAEFRDAGRSWFVPTFNLVFADVEGHIGFQTVGRIPLRKHAERGYRPGWDPEHQWYGFIPYDDLPHLIDPARGFALTANNRVAPDDFAYPMFGCWGSGYRARRIREQIEAKPKWSREECRMLQMDVASGRAAGAVPALIAILENETDPRIGKAVALLKKWDFRIAAESPAAAIFNVFFVHWCRRVMRERVPEAIAEFAAANAGGVAFRLLHGDRTGWFQTDRRAAIREAFQDALQELETKLGPDPAAWRWGRLHPLLQKHFLSGRGDLGLLLDRSGLPAPGDATTVNSGTPDANFAAWLGAGYRMVADLSDPQLGIWSVEVGSQSGHPGSPHYDDQAPAWERGELYYLPLK
jgi:penicillin amidase